MLNQHHHPTHHIILTQGSKIVFSILLKNTNILVLIRSDFFGYISGPKLFENFQSCTDSSPPIQIVFCQSKEKLSLKCAKENRLLVSLQANPNGWSDVWSGVNFFLEKMQFSSCQLNSRAHITTGGVHIWREKIFVQTLKNVCAHLEKERKICAHLEKYLCTFGNRFVHILKRFVYIWVKKVFVHIWQQLCAHSGKDLLGILQFAFMPARADNDAGGWVFGGNLWMQGRNTGLQQLLQSQNQIYCFQVYFYDHHHKIGCTICEA